MQMTTGEETKKKAAVKARGPGRKTGRKTPGRKAGKKPASPVDTLADTPLIIWSAQAQATDPLLAPLSGMPRPLELVGTLPDPGALQTGAEAPEMLLLCSSPVAALCRAMAEGVAPGEALAGWRAQARAVLAVNRRNRRRVHVMDVALVLEDPCGALAGFGVEGPATGAQTGTEDAGKDAEAAAQADGTADPVLALLAQGCLNGDATARALAGELEAVMRLGGDPVTYDPDAAFQLYREAGWSREEAGLLRTQMSLMLEESELLQARNRAAQDEMRAVSENALMLEQRLEQLNEGIASYQVQLEELCAERDAAQHRVGELQRALEARDGELAEARQRGDEARRALEARDGELAGLRAHAEGLQGWIHQLETSHSYRVTAPLRWISRVLLRRQR